MLGKGWLREHENMNIGNEAHDRRNEIEMRHDKCSMLGAKWSGWYITPTKSFDHSEDKVEHRARLGLRDGRKASVENRDRDRTLSLRSVRYEDSAYPSGKNQPVSDNFAAISEDWSDNKRNSTFQIDQNATRPVILSSAVKALTGPVTPLTHTSQSKESAT